MKRQCIIFEILISSAELSNLAKKPNYNFEKSRKEQERKKKKEEKRQRKLEASRERREEPSADGQVTDDAPPE
jgi:hypothetical protein